MVNSIEIQWCDQIFYILNNVLFFKYKSAIELKLPLYIVWYYKRNAFVNMFCKNK